MKCTVEQQDRIVGERFETLCDIVYKPGQALPNQTGVYIVFSKTDFVAGLLNECRKNTQNKYIIVTHHSDYPIDERIFGNAPSNIVKWFGINITYDHPILESIPLGSASSTWIGTSEFAEAKDSPEFTIIDEDNQFEYVAQKMIALFRNRVKTENDPYSAASDICELFEKPVNAKQKGKQRGK